MRVLIADDEPLASRRLSQLCADLKWVEVVGTAADGAEALQLIRSLVPDLVLLDIAMPGIDGIEVARALQEEGSSTSIVFVTAHSNFAILAFELAAADYLLKPISFDRLAKALRRQSAAPDRSDETEAEIWVAQRSSLVRLEFRAIDLVEAERDYVRLHVGPNSYLLRGRISDLEQRLGSTGFTRVHRSIIVPRRRIKSLKRRAGGRWMATLDDGRTIPVSRTFMSGLRRLYTMSPQDL